MRLANTVRPSLPSTIVRNVSDPLPSPRPVEWPAAIEAILSGTDLVWMALPGDANLDRTTDVSDLPLLAGNFRKTTGQTWLQGDFNFDGAVDVSDLSLLAGRFRQSRVPCFRAVCGRMRSLLHDRERLPVDLRGLIDSCRPRPGAGPWPVDQMKGRRRKHENVR